MSSSRQVSLHSVTMEDLTQEPESKHRMLMVSHAPHVPNKAVFVSKSCPDFGARYPAARLRAAPSLPGGLDAGAAPPAQVAQPLTYQFYSALGREELGPERKNAGHEGRE